MATTMSLRFLALVQLTAAMVLGPLALWMTGLGQPDNGLVVSVAEERVIAVFPGGPSWHDGLRPGQRLVEIAAGTDPSAWRVVTSDESQLYGTSYERQLATLRSALPTAAAAVLLAAAALIAARQIKASAALSAGALVLAGAALMPSGHTVITALGAVAGIMGPAVWLAAFGLRRHTLRFASLCIGVVVALAWLGSRYLAPEAFDPIDTARQATVGGATLSTVVLFGNWRRLARRVWAGSATWTDAVAGAVLLGVSLAIVVVLELPLVAAAALVVPALLLYPRFRKVMATAIDRIVLGDVRDRASIRAVEDERSRIARDIHDAPLQEVAAVIRQLDGQPGTEEQTELLRSVADHLRRMTTELRPPILDDLGLPAAIAYVGEQAAAKAPQLEITLEVVPEDHFVDRPPPEVELAVFRIVQEAVDNAIEHADARSLRIAIDVAARRVSAVVDDDGRGVSDVDVRRAVREGHFGFASMSQRASLIGASLRIDTRKPSGTRVVVEWEADP
jgi:signal transduction histidine kinase